MILDGPDDDALYACATINKDNVLSVQVLNTSSEKIIYNMELKGLKATITIDANALQTVQVQL
jgi:hypothetical protein